MGQYVVPIYNENIIGKNESSNSMWKNSNQNFVDKMIDILIDKEFNIFLKYIGTSSKNKISDLINTNLEAVDIFSKEDLRKIGFTRWVFYFECEEKTYSKIKKRINLFLLASRIFKNADFGVQYYICISESGKFSKESDNWSYAIASFQEKNMDEINEQDLTDIIEGYKKLLAFNNLNYFTQHVIQFLFLSYTSYYYLSSFILLMTALETLVSPSKVSETITKDIIVRVVSFIDNKKICSKTKFEKIYKFRSNIIHGRIMSDNDLNKDIGLFNSLQKITLVFLKKILTEIDFEKEYKTGDSKDKYFSELLRSR